MSNLIQSSYQNPTAASGAVNLRQPDLTKFPPRSPRTRLGGYVQLPRLIDNARAFAAGTIGDFHFNCPIEQRFFTFTGVNPEAFLAEIKAGKSDSELLTFVQATASPPRHPSEIAAWSHWFEHNSRRSRPTVAPSSTKSTGRTRRNATTSPPGSTGSSLMTT